MVEKVVSLDEERMKRQYQEYYCGQVVNAGIDTVFPVKKNKRDIRKEMIRGYMELLSNQIR